MKISNNKTFIVGAAVTGLMLGSVPAMRAASSSDSPAFSTGAGQFASTPDAKKEKHACKGQNSCKGKGGCKTGDNGCKSKNSCKGKGGCSTDGSKKPA